MQSFRAHLANSFQEVNQIESCISIILTQDLKEIKTKNKETNEGFPFFQDL